MDYKFELTWSDDAVDTFEKVFKCLHCSSALPLGLKLREN